VATRRRAITPSPSFFSFQDIMMCCLGIMMLVATAIGLLMAVRASAVEQVDRTSQSAQMDAERDAEREEIASLEARIAAAVALQNRDLSGEVAHLLAELEADQQVLLHSAERLRRQIRKVERARGADGADPALNRISALLVKRDGLQQTLQEMESRRRLTFLTGEGADRTRVFEVSAARIVEGPAMGDGHAQVHAVRSADHGAEVLLERMRIAESTGLTCLIALKPSGFDVYGAMGRRRSSASRPRGLELISEDRWISDQFPNWSESDHGQ
jgi:hypothetical protein